MRYLYEYKYKNGNRMVGGHNLETATIDPQSMLNYRNCLLDILKGDNNE